jgi:hypothetical protein
MVWSILNPVSAAGVHLHSIVRVTCYVCKKQHRISSKQGNVTNNNKCNYYLKDEMIIHAQHHDDLFPHTIVIHRIPGQEIKGKLKFHASKHTRKKRNIA